MKTLLKLFIALLFVSCSNSASDSDDYKLECNDYIDDVSSVRDVAERYEDEILTMNFTIENILRVTKKVEEDMREICIYPDFEDDRCLDARVEHIIIYQIWLLELPEPNVPGAKVDLFVRLISMCKSENMPPS